MKSFRENPDGEENQTATRQTNREVFALQQMANKRRKVCACCETVMITSSEFCNICDAALDLATEGHVMFITEDDEGPQE